MGKEATKEKVMRFALNDVLAEKGINMTRAAAQCDLSYPTIWSIVNNDQVQISLVTIQKLCAGLDVTPNDLLRWVD